MISVQENHQRSLGSIPNAEDVSSRRTRNARVTSRRYNLALDPGRFAPYVDYSAEWMGIVATEACGQGMNFELDTGSPRYFKCSYIDTVDGYLGRNGLFLQVIDEGLRDSRYRIRLTGVHRDRYLAAMTSVAGRVRASNEFVEEIFPAYSRYAKSSEERRRKLPRLYTVNDVMKLFPGTGKLLEPRRGDAVTIVDGVIAYQLADLIGKGFAGDAAPLTFELSASYTGLWRLGRRIDGELERHMPDNVDFTFGYESLASDTGLEQFPCDNIIAGCHLFDSFCSKRSWVDRERCRAWDTF